jgi:hypothetical protein
MSPLERTRRFGKDSASMAVALQPKASILEKLCKPLVINLKGMFSCLGARSSGAIGQTFSASHRRIEARDAIPQRQMFSPSARRAISYYTSI